MVEKIWSNFHTMNGSTTVRLTVSHRSLELQPGDDPISTFFFFVFGGIALFVICSMARGQRLAQREAIERQEAERCRQTLEATQAATKLRKRLANAFQVQGLVKVLKASDMVIPSDSNSDVDLEKGPDSSPPLQQRTTEDCIDRAESDEESSERIHAAGPAVVVSPDEDDDEMKEEVDLANIATPEKDQLGDADELELGKVNIRRDDVSVSIPILCAICLERYTEGASVVLSGNASCTHGFHQECILEYLVHHGDEAAPCPCCRQIFLPMKNTKQKWKKNVAN